MSEIEKKLEGWVEVVNPTTWQILRVVEERPRGMREIRESGFRMSATTVNKYVNKFEKLGLLRTEKMEKWPFKRMVGLTELGGELLAHIDAIGEIVKKTKEKSDRFQCPSCGNWLSGKCGRSGKRICAECGRIFSLQESSLVDGVKLDETRDDLRRRTQLYLAKICGDLNVSKKVEAKCWSLLKKFNRWGCRTVVAGAVYIVANRCGERRTQREIMEASNTSQPAIRKRYNEIAEKLDLDLKP